MTKIKELIDWMNEHNEVEGRPYTTDWDFRSLLEMFTMGEGSSGGYSFRETDKSFIVELKRKKIVPKEYVLDLLEDEEVDS